MKKVISNILIFLILFKYCFALSPNRINYEEVLSEKAIESYIVQLTQKMIQNGCENPGEDLHKATEYKNINAIITILLTLAPPQKYNYKLYIFRHPCEPQKYKHENEEKYPAIEVISDESYAIGRPNLLVVYNNKRIVSKKDPIVMLGPSHVDVVPVLDSKYWKYPPFSGYIDKNGFMHGRGSFDMLALTSQQVGAFITHVRKMQIIPEEKRNSVTVMGCFVSNEENGSVGGAEAVIKKLKEDKRFEYIKLKERPFVSFIEGGGNNYGEPGTKNAHNYTISAAEKGFVGIEIECTGEVGTDSDKNVENIADRVQSIISGIDFLPVKGNLPLLRSAMKGFGSVKALMGKYLGSSMLRKIIGSKAATASQVKTTIIPGPRFSEESYSGKNEIKALSNQMTPEVEMFFSTKLSPEISITSLKKSINNIIRKAKLSKKVIVEYLKPDDKFTVIFKFLCKGKAAHAATGSADKSAESIATKLKTYMKRGVLLPGSKKSLFFRKNKKNTFVPIMPIARSSTTSHKGERSIYEKIFSMLAKKRATVRLYYSGRLHFNTSVQDLEKILKDEIKSVGLSDSVKIKFIYAYEYSENETGPFQDKIIDIITNVIRKKFDPKAKLFKIMLPAATDGKFIRFLGKELRNPMLALGTGLHHIAIETAKTLAHATDERYPINGITDGIPFFAELIDAIAQEFNNNRDLNFLIRRESLKTAA